MGQNRIVVHFPAVRQGKFLSVGTALERGWTDLGMGTGTRGGQHLALSQQARSLGKESLKPNQTGKEQNAQSLISAMQTWDGQKQQFCHVIGSQWWKQTKLNQSVAFIICANRLPSCLLMAERIYQWNQNATENFFFFLGEQKVWQNCCLPIIHII